MRCGDTRESPKALSASSSPDREGYEERGRRVGNPPSLQRATSSRLDGRGQRNSVRLARYHACRINGKAKSGVDGIRAPPGCGGYGGRRPKRWFGPAHLPLEWALWLTINKRPPKR